MVGCTMNEDTGDKYFAMRLGSCFAGYIYNANFIYYQPYFMSGSIYEFQTYI